MNCAPTSPPGGCFFSVFREKSAGGTDPSGKTGWVNIHQDTHIIDSKNVSIERVLKAKDIARLLKLSIQFTPRPTIYTTFFQMHHDFGQCTRFPPKMHHKTEIHQGEWKMHQRIISGAPSPCHSIKIVVLSQRNRKDSNSPEKTNMTCHCCPIMRSRIVGVPESMLIHFLYLILENESPSSESDSLYQSTCPLPE